MCKATYNGSLCMPLPLVKYSRGQISLIQFRSFRTIFKLMFYPDSLVRVHILLVTLITPSSGESEIFWKNQVNAIFMRCQDINRHVIVYGKMRCSSLLDNQSQPHALIFSIDKRKCKHFHKYIKKAKSYKCLRVQFTVGQHIAKQWLSI